MAVGGKGGRDNGGKNVNPKAQLNIDQYRRRTGRSELHRVTFWGVFFTTKWTLNFVLQGKVTRKQMKDSKHKTETVQQDIKTSALRYVIVGFGILVLWFFIAYIVWVSAGGKW